MAKKIGPTNYHKKTTSTNFTKSDQMILLFFLIKTKHSFYPPFFKGGGVEPILGNFQKGGLAEGQKKGGWQKGGLIFLKFSPAAAFHILIKPILCTLNYKKTILFYTFKAYYLILSKK